MAENCAAFKWARPDIRCGGGNGGGGGAGDCRGGGDGDGYVGCGGEQLMRKPGIVGAAAYIGPPTIADAGNGGTSAWGAVHTTSLV